MQMQCQKPIMAPGEGPHKAEFRWKPASAERGTAAGARKTERRRLYRFCAAKSQFSSLSITASTYAARLFW